MMTAKIQDMFGGKPPRLKPRIMAHMVDVGEGVLFKCKKCGWESGWLFLGEKFTDTQVYRGVPCKTCNKEAPNE